MKELCSAGSAQITLGSQGAAVTLKAGTVRLFAPPEGEFGVLLYDDYVLLRFEEHWTLNKKKPTGSFDFTPPRGSRRQGFNLRLGNDTELWATFLTHLESLPFFKSASSGITPQRSLESGTSASSVPIQQQQQQQRTSSPPLSVEAPPGLAMPPGLHTVHQQQQREQTRPVSIQSADPSAASTPYNLLPIAQNPHADNAAAALLSHSQQILQPQQHQQLSLSSHTPDAHLHLSSSSSNAAHTNAAMAIQQLMAGGSDAVVPAIYAPPTQGYHQPPTVYPVPPRTPSPENLMTDHQWSAGKDTEKDRDGGGGGGGGTVLRKIRGAGTDGQRSPIGESPRETTGAMQSHSRKIQNVPYTSPSMSIQEMRKPSLPLPDVGVQSASVDEPGPSAGPPSRGLPRGNRGQQQGEQESSPDFASGVPSFSAETSERFALSLFVPGVDQKVLEERSKPLAAAPVHIHKAAEEAFRKNFPDKKDDIPYEPPLVDWEWEEEKQSWGSFGIGPLAPGDRIRLDADTAFASDYIHAAPSPRARDGGSGAGPAWGGGAELRDMQASPSSVPLRSPRGGDLRSPHPSPSSSSSAAAAAFPPPTNVKSSPRASAGHGQAAGGSGDEGLGDFLAQELVGCKSVGDLWESMRTNFESHLQDPKYGCVVDGRVPREPGQRTLGDLLLICHRIITEKLGFSVRDPAFLEAVREARDGGWDMKAHRSSDQRHHGGQSGGFAVDIRHSGVRATPDVLSSRRTSSSRPQTIESSVPVILQDPSRDHLLAEQLQKALDKEEEEYPALGVAPAASSLSQGGKKKGGATPGGSGVGTAQGPPASSSSSSKPQHVAGGMSSPPTVLQPPTRAPATESFNMPVSRREGGREREKGLPQRERERERGRGLDSSGYAEGGHGGMGAEASSPASASMPIPASGAGLPPPTPFDMRNGGGQLSESSPPSSSSQTLQQPSGGVKLDLNALLPNRFSDAEGRLESTERERERERPQHSESSLSLSERDREREAQQMLLPEQQQTAPTPPWKGRGDERPLPSHTTGSESLTKRQQQQQQHRPLHEGLPPQEKEKERESVATAPPHHRGRGTPSYDPAAESAKRERQLGREGERGEMDHRDRDRQEASDRFPPRDPNSSSSSQYPAHTHTPREREREADADGGDMGAEAEEEREVDEKDLTGQKDKTLMYRKKNSAVLFTREYDAETPRVTRDFVDPLRQQTQHRTAVPGPAGRAGPKAGGQITASSPPVPPFVSRLKEIAREHHVRGKKEKIENIFLNIPDWKKLKSDEDRLVYLTELHALAPGSSIRFLSSTLSKDHDAHLKSSGVPPVAKRLPFLLDALHISPFPCRIRGFKTGKRPQKNDAICSMQRVKIQPWGLAWDFAWSLDGDDVAVLYCLASWLRREALMKVLTAATNALLDEQRASSGRRQPDDKIDENLKSRVMKDHVREKLRELQTEVMPFDKVFQDAADIWADPGFSTFWLSGSESSHSGGGGGSKNRGGHGMSDRDRDRERGGGMRGDGYRGRGALQQSASSDRGERYDRGGGGDRRREHQRDRGERERTDGGGGNRGSSSRGEGGAANPRTANVNGDIGEAQARSRDRSRERESKFEDMWMTGRTNGIKSGDRDRDREKDRERIMNKGRGRDRGGHEYESFQSGHEGGGTVGGAHLKSLKEPGRHQQQGNGVVE
uniref:Uncharacterized protein n=1 Tax=Chromera velia CCMP2878 TaxID=1169474 RepID=A0A0G4HQF4_9ALVE|eukprot:Cvel_7975.t1-p1 / transcript=Cvel_7975.t1 / gene=Cvel_7975 / organism=Chromera_velia_CCMP2878 / gene_product=hypothetical protein / transcript_product=hypothetical protein / location=Cvel_scaffold429:36722-45565(+) / protein_length=1672 / sequence_SO=supercontig / SO=protein_coding / is_pseudo=false